MPTSKEIDLDYMRRFATQFVEANEDYFTKHCGAIWTQRDNYRFPLDIHLLDEYSRMDPKEVMGRYHKMLERINIRAGSEQEKEEQRARVIEQFDIESDKASLHECAQEILEWLDSNPVEMLEAMNKALKKVMEKADEVHKDDYYPPEFEIFNWPSSSIERLTFEDIGKLKSITGWIAYIENPPHVVYTEKYYKCGDCGQSMAYESKPKVCSFCGQKADFRFDPAKSKGKLVQELFIMENFEDVTSQSTPGIISVFVEGGNINKYSIGDRLEVIGIVNQFNKKLSIYLGLNVLSCKIMGNIEISISKEEEKQIFEISKDPWDYIHKAFASSIIGQEYDIIKESLAISIAGGADSQKRDKIHILMIGNPGVGKSELLKAIKNDSPKGFYVSDASGPGLTAAISEVNGSRVMVPGMLVLANRGVLGIDELDKMRKEDTVALHSAMEQLEFTKSKAGIKMRFETATTVIAAANPINSIFDQKKTILEQINLPESLLQRFDLIWAITGNAEINSYSILQNTETSDDPLLRKYFAYCARIQPSSARVEKQISSYFDNLRHQSGDIMINARTLLAMKRIVQASARLHLRNQANEDDLATMERIFQAYLQQFNFSVSNIYMPSGLKERLSRILELFKTKRHWDKADLLHESAMEDPDFFSAIDILKREGYIFEPKNGKYEVI